MFLRQRRINDAMRNKYTNLVLLQNIRTQYYHNYNMKDKLCFMISKQRSRQWNNYESLTPLRYKVTITVHLRNYRLHVILQYCSYISCFWSIPLTHPLFQTKITPTSIPIKNMRRTFIQMRHIFILQVLGLGNCYFMAIL